MPQLLNTAKVLILRSGAIGDIILTFPLVLSCIELYGRDNVVCAAPGFMKPVAYLAGIDGFIDLDTCGMHRLFSADFQAEEAPAVLGEYDLILNCLTGKDDLLHEHLTLCSSHVRSITPPHNSIGMHAAEYLASLLPESASLPEARIMPERFSVLPDNIRSLFGSGRPAAAVHPGTGSPHKLVSPDLFERLISHHARDKTVIILTGPADRNLVPFVQNMSRTYGCPHLDSVPLAQAAYVIWRSVSYIGLDSGISHLAGMTGTPCRVIFTATDPAVWRPYSSSVTAAGPDEMCPV